jgi:hypothetical protein
VRRYKITGFKELLTANRENKIKNQGILIYSAKSNMIVIYSNPILFLRVNKASNPYKTRIFTTYFLKNGVGLP